MTATPLQREVAKPFGPTYPKLPSVDKFRRMARDGLSALDPFYRRAYGEAVEKAILALQRSELRRASPPDHRSNCASGTWHTTGEEIHKAVLQQQRAALAACPRQERRARQPDQWRYLYEVAMAAKRKRQAHANDQSGEAA